VNDSLLMGIVYGPGQGFHQRCGGLGRLRFAGEFLRQGAAVHEFQGEIGVALGLADLVNLHDVRVLQPRLRLRLRPEAAQVLGVRLGAGQEHLEGHQALQALVAGLVDNAHAPAAQDA